ncbi:MAG: FRG domain-containing protein [Candidatus Hydrogenedentes bacterium]|nr:FRG domain-containing protein [Candidatus Hydrogenedentota bacterium]
MAEFIKRVTAKLSRWPKPCVPWFRGESQDLRKRPALRPRVAEYKEQENFLLQSFRRKAGGFAHIPPFERTDLWLFLAQHHNVPTRLLDWTEGALIALFFATNELQEDPVVYMLNSWKLNYLAIECLRSLSPLDFAARLGMKLKDAEPEEVEEKAKREQDELEELTKRPSFESLLTWPGTALGYVNIAPAWEEGGKRSGRTGAEVPMAIPTTYQETRMISQRSCFTVHGSRLDSMVSIIEDKAGSLEDFLIPFCIDGDKDTQKRILSDLATLGVGHASIFPDLDRLGLELKAEAERRRDCETMEPRAQRSDGPDTPSGGGSHGLNVTSTGPA